MITIAIILAAAASAGVASGSLIYRRLRRKPVAVPPPPVVEDRGPIALGDVVVLDNGHGRELWAARQLSFCEGDVSPFLVLFEADGRATERAILAWDPAAPDAFALLEPVRPPWGDGLLQRLPTTLDTDAGPLSLRARRSATGVFSRAVEAEGRSSLPLEGSALVGVYAGGARAYAVVVRDASERMKLYVGHVVSLSTVSLFNASESDRSRDR